MFCDSEQERIQSPVKVCRKLIDFYRVSCKMSQCCENRATSANIFCHLIQSQTKAKLRPLGRWERGLRSSSPAPPPRKSATVKRQMDAELVGTFCDWLCEREKNWKPFCSTCIYVRIFMFCAIQILAPQMFARASDTGSRLLIFMFRIIFNEYG